MTLNPIIFSDGNSYYQELGKKYIKHEFGLFILAPSGVGKTYYCQSQSENHWIDGDELWVGTNAQPDPSEKWWTQGLDVINIIDQRSDVVTVDAKLEGFWIMGASNYWLKPDAIVIPDWDTHVKYIKTRQENNYDGGATLDALEQVKSHRESINKWNSEHGVPKFKSIDEAVNNLISESR